MLLISLSISSRKTANKWLMEQLTKEQICIQIDKLSRELTTYQAMLDEINAQEDGEFARKVKAMVGGYYMKDLGDSKWYCRIDRVGKVRDSHIDGLYANCGIVAASISIGTERRCWATHESIYINESDIDDFKPITEGEFDAVLAQVYESWKKI